MKVGQIFDLPKDILYKVGHIGTLRDEHQAKIGKYEVVETDDGIKGRVIVTYGHKRRNGKSADNGR